MKPKATLTLILSILFLIFIFTFTKHYVDLSETIETWLAYKGLAYYKDFSVYHFPLGRISMWPLHLIFNWSFVESPFVGLFMGVGILIILYYWGKKFISDAGTAITLIFFTIFWWFVATQVTYDHEMMMGLFLTCSLVTFWGIFKSPVISLKKVFLLGIFTSLTLLTGQLSGITIAILMLITIFITRIKKYKNQVSFWGLFIFITLGFALPFGLVLLYIAKIGALYDFYKWNIPYYFTYASDAKQNFYQLPWRDLLIYYSPMIVLTILTFFNYLKTKRLNSLEVILIIINLASLPFNLLSVFHPRHLLYSLPLSAMTAGVAFNHQATYLKAKKRLIILWMASIGVYFILVLLPFYKNHLIYPPTLRIFNDVYPGDNVYETVNWIKDNTPTKSKIMVMGDGLIYVRADRLPASRPSRGIPYSWEPINEVKKEVQASPPDYWIVDQQFVKRMHTNYPEFHVTDFIEHEMLNCFKLVKTFDKWQIWQRDYSCRI